MYFLYTNLKLRNLNTDFTLGNCLFGSVKLTETSDLNKYKDSGHGIGFDSCLKLSFTYRCFVKNVIIFGADMSASMHIDNNEKDILILGEGPTRTKGYYISNLSKISY